MTQPNSPPRFFVAGHHLAQKSRWMYLSHGAEIRRRGSRVEVREWADRPPTWDRIRVFYPARWPPVFFVAGAVVAVVVDHL